jgi:hypothetical protein
MRSMSAPPELVDLDGIPAASKPLWQRLLGEELLPVHDLFRQLKDYQKEFEERARWLDGTFDPTTARSLCVASFKMLGLLNEGTPEPTRRAVQAAVRYLLIEEDADSDLESILGLDDDAEVINAVLRHLGHEDWQVELL